MIHGIFWTVASWIVQRDPTPVITQGGQLTPQQQESFDRLVGRIAELRNANDSRHPRPADADLIGARILRCFGVRATPAEVAVIRDAGTVMQTPDHTRTVMPFFTAVPGDTGIAAQAPEDTRIFSVPRQPLVDGLA